MSLKELAPEQLQEMSMIEMAFYILEKNKQAVSFQELWDQLVEAVGMSEEEAKAKIAQFYTDMNIDGRFISVGENRWGLRSWYPVDQIEDDAIAETKTKKKKKKKAVVEDDLDEEFDEDEFDDEDLDLLDDEDYDEDDEDLDDDDFDEDDDFDDDDLDDDDFEDDEDL